QVCFSCLSVNGGWSDWSAWGACSVTCGGGYKTRTRSCSNPSPSGGGRQCVGDGTEIQSCIGQFCPSVNGGWSYWSAWGACSVTCGGGYKTRTRSCSNPSPSGGGRQCVGEASKKQNCGEQDC
ncbi:Thrombospondin-1, partial [Lamellibrachia satsuma]